MDPWRLFLLDQGFPVEYELDEFNTPHTGTTLRHPQNWLCRLRCNISPRHLATSSMGNIFWRHSRFSPKQPEPQTHGDFNVSPLKQQTRLLQLISPSHIQQCLNLTMHFSLRHLAAKMLSQLSHNLISFPYFFPSYETCSINVNPLFYAAIKNLTASSSSSYFFIIHLYFPTTLSEGITHTHARTRFFAKNGNKHSYR